LAQPHDAQKKAVSLLFSGKGKRRVSVGYVVESPVWKTTYRLVLGQGKEDKPYQQGWVVVESPSDEDWREVKTALVSGRSVSFRMDLYQPLYVPRPLVVPELFASLSPVAYSGALGAPQGPDGRGPDADGGRKEGRPAPGKGNDGGEGEERGRAACGGGPGRRAGLYSRQSGTAHFPRSTRSWPAIGLGRVILRLRRVAKL
jgi:hypothetical protein